MGGVVEGGVALGKRTSPQTVAIEKVQSDLRQEYDVQDVRRRELDYLEKGGNPLDFLLGNSASLSVQSTSAINQFVTSEAKGSSPADSVESSGRPRAFLEPNRMLFNGDTELPEVGKSQIDGNENAIELKDCAAFNLPKKAYKRRSRPNREAVLARGSNSSSLSSSHAPKEVKGLDVQSHKDQDVNLTPANIDETDRVQLSVVSTVENNGQKVPTEIVSEAHETFIEREKVNSTEEVEEQVCNTLMNGISSLKGVLDSESSCTNEMFDSIKDVKEPQQTLVKDEPDEKIEEKIEEKKETQPDNSVVLHIETNSVHPIIEDKSCVVEPDEELMRSASSLQKDVNNQILVEVVEEENGGNESVTERKDDISVKVGPTTQIETALLVTQPECTAPELLEANSAGLPEEVISKANKDSILKEALVIEAKRRRIVELSRATFPAINRQKSHWDYVLEEMAWLANDFAQERLWKITAASQICHQVAFTSRLRFQKQHSIREQKKVAHVLSKAVTEFWLSVKDKNKKMDQMHAKKDSRFSIRDYAVRFLKFNSSEILQNQAEAPIIPDRSSESGSMDISMEDHWTEVSLFYTVPCGAMEAYKKLIVSNVEQKTVSGIDEDMDLSACNTVTDFRGQNNGFEEGEASVSNFAQRKKKHLTKGYGTGITQVLDDKVGSNKSPIMGKRPASLNVSGPTKRVRTAIRQHRVISPYTVGPSPTGFAQLPLKTEASSGENSSQNALHGGGLNLQTNMEVESVGDFETQFPLDSAEVSKPKKKKKAKHMNSSYDQTWQADSHFQIEQRDHSKKKLMSNQLESNGSGGVFGQPVAKKPKIMRPTQDISSKDTVPVGGSVPSPVASQMSNMSNPNKLVKILGVKDRGRKSKTHKVPSGQQGCGNPWSLFEDQALVVLVHDMGTNWELISDAFNSTLQFKCMYRKPKECSERHKMLMDRSSGDGGDSAEESVSSQPYNSTLPGIPKGHARGLFQRLQGPMEEDTLKSHFEKIMAVTQKQPFRKTQKNEKQQLQPTHSSHMLALSQVFPNNLNGGAALTPVDLADASTSSSSPEIVTHGYQSPKFSGSNQGNVAPAATTAGSAAINNLSASTNNNNTAAPRLSVPRAAAAPIPLQIDQHRRIQQYNQMVSSGNRNVQLQPPPPSARMLLPGGGGGVVNRSVALGRPAFQGSAFSSSPPIMGPSELLKSGNSLGVSSSAPNQASYPPFHHHPHMLPAQHLRPTNTQQAYARFAKEKQHLQQRILQQPQATSFSPLTPATSVISMPPHQMPPHLLGRQQQFQQFQQFQHHHRPPPPTRHHPLHQRLIQNNNKQLVNGVGGLGRGNIPPFDASLQNQLLPHATPLVAAIAPRPLVPSLTNQSPSNSQRMLLLHNRQLSSEQLNKTEECCSSNSSSPMLLQPGNSNGVVSQQLKPSVTNTTSDPIKGP